MLGWMAFTLASAMIWSVRFGAEQWMQITLATMLAIDFVVFIGLYIYFSLTNTDALRSERFSIQKMAIERNLLGDSVSGLRDITPTDTSPKAIANPTPQLGTKP